MRDALFSFQKKEQTRGEITHKTQTLIQDSFSFAEQGLTSSILEKYSHFYTAQSSPFHSQIYSRGFGQNKINTTIDGISLNFSNYDNSLLLNMIDASNFDKIELLYGNNSIHYGSNAIGGAINFVSDKDNFTDKKSLFAKVTLHFNSNTNALTPKISFGFSNSKFRTKFQFSAYCPRTYEIGKKHNDKNNTWGQELGIVEWQNDLKQDEYKISLNPNTISQSQFKLFQVGNQSTLKLGNESSVMLGLYYSRLDDATQTHTTQNKDAFQFFAKNSDNISLFVSTLGFQFNKKQRLFSKLNINLGYSTLEQTTYFRKYQSPYEKSLAFNTSKLELNIDAHKNFNWKWVLFYGVNAKIESANSFSEANSKNAILPAYYSNFFNIFSPETSPATIKSSTYLKIERRIDDKTALFAGINFGMQQLKYNFLNIEPFNFIDYEKLNVIHTSYNAQISWTRHSCENSNYAATAFFSSRMPDGFNISTPLSTTVLIPNENLKNENILGMEGHFYRKFDDMLEIQIAPYAYLYQNKIGTKAFDSLYDNVTFDETYKVYTRANIAESYVLGANIDARYHFSKQWMGYFSINYNYGVQKDTQIYLDDIPPIYGNIGIKGHQGKFSTHFWVNYNGAKPISFYNPSNEMIKSFAAIENNRIVGTPEFFILNMSCGYQFNKHIQANLALNNVFDAHYRKYMSGICGLGRNLQVSMLFKL
jgi:hemoglobin/transferrin/lactoferrin receptor protein